jgi:hypothetical protein
MAELTTGVIENTPVAGVRPTTTLTVKITNDDTIDATVFIEGFYVTGTTKTLYPLQTGGSVLACPRKGVGWRRRRPPESGCSGMQP